jgi:hypothetical protein
MTPLTGSPDLRSTSACWSPSGVTLTTPPLQRSGRVPGNGSVLPSRSQDRLAPAGNRDSSLAAVADQALVRQPRRPVQIANCSGFYGDRLAAAREMLADAGLP